MVVYLIGFMGTGKSVVGLKLSRKLNIPLLDMDDEIVRRDGRSIPEIFAQDGEDAFRDMEEALLREIAYSDKDLIVSCGGGIVLREENRRILKENPYTVQLLAMPQTIAKRAGGDPNRPLLRDTVSVDEIRSRMEKRMPLYRECASLNILTDSYTSNETAKRIIDQLDLEESRRKETGSKA